MYKIIIWGMGNIYNSVRNSLRYFELTNQIEVVGITDSSAVSGGVIDGYRIYDKNYIKELDFDYIVIMSKRYFLEISSTLLQMEIGKSQILSFKIFQIPNIDLKDYISIKEHRITILSNNCWGGLYIQHWVWNVFHLQRICLLRMKTTLNL